jgi:hypothetical protein
LINLWLCFYKKLGKGLNNAIYDRYFSNDIEDPIGKSTFWLFELYQRIKLFPWWIKYNLGLTEESELKNKIIHLATEMKLEKRWTKDIVRHAVSEFSKKGLGKDYYGYHNIEHELEATYFTLLAANGHIKQNKDNNFFFSKEDIKYLFVSALFHDYDPSKKFDKPNEKSIEKFLRNDLKIKKFVDIAGIDINVVIAIIYRTAYPFKGKIAEHTIRRIEDLLLSNCYSDGYQDKEKRLNHYLQFGWFLSICERIAGYTLGNFQYAIRLATTNALALGWHPSVINQESVKYFESLKNQENEMLQFVLEAISPILKNNFFNNISSFKKLYEKEKRIRHLVLKKEIEFICKLEDIDNSNNLSNQYLQLKSCILDIYSKIPLPLKRGQQHFISSLSDPNTILITLRMKEKRQYSKQKIKIDKERKEKIIDIIDYNDICKKESIVGYVKGGPIEKYGFRYGTLDESYGKKNTAYMECIGIRIGYWSSGGGHLLRMNFLLEAKKRGYKFVTGYLPRKVITDKINKGESIHIVKKYDPDKLDYYRIDLNNYK